MISIKAVPSVERETKACMMGRNGMKILVLIALTFLLALVATFFSLVSLITGGGNSAIFVFGILVVIKSIMDFFRMKHYPENQIKREKERVPDKVCHYTFDEDISTFEESGTGSFVHSEYKYSVYKKAVYSDGWFMLKFERNVIAFNEKDFEEGKPEQLIKLLREKLGENFEEK